MSTYISKSEYGNMKLVPGLLCAAGAYGSYSLYDSYTGFSAFLTGILFIPLAIILGYYAIINLSKYFEIRRVPDYEWDEYIKKERILFSKATYKHPQTGDVQTVRRGFSIPVFLFGGFVPLVKGQFSLAFKFFVILYLLDALGFIIPIIGTIITHFLTSYGIARVYNKYYEDYLIDEGYIIQDAHSGLKTVSNVKQITQNVWNANDIGTAYNEVKKGYQSNPIELPESFTNSNNNTIQEVHNGIKCTNCGVTNDKEDTFCYNCETHLGSVAITNSSIESVVEDSFVICPICGEENDFDNDFCITCGNKLSTN